MSTHLPTAVRSAVSDPKCASESALMDTLNFYHDEIEPESLDLVAEELVRRGGDPEYLGMVSSFEMSF